MHDAFGVRLHAGKQAEVCHRHPKMSYGLLFKLDLRGVRQPQGIVLRRPSHTGRENPRTPAPPIHSGIEAHVRTTTTGAEP
jgi:hypothetical protein